MEKAVLFAADLIAYVFVGVSLSDTVQNVVYEYLLSCRITGSYDRIVSS